MDIVQEARKYIKDHKKELCLKFANIDEYPSVIKPYAYFMAGSPGAGKTEWSKFFIKALVEKEPTRKIVRIDPDEIREFIPNYIPEQAHLFQSAVSLGVDKILDYVFKYNQDFLLDGTFAHYNSSYKNIKISLSKGRKVGILYVYQKPEIAWSFTKKRAAIEKRTIPKDAFIQAFFSSRDNVNQIKAEFGNKIELDLIIKDYKQDVETIHFNISNIDHFLKIGYNSQTLNEVLL